MTGSHLQQYMVFCYLLLWVSRIRGVLRRAKQPHLRGEGWFFDVPVAADFYQGPGRLILRGYWLRMAIPCVLDIPAVVMLLTGHTSWLLWVILALVPAIHVNHLYNVSIAERQAWPFARVEQALTNLTSTVGLSLTPRRLRDYTSWPLEWVLGLATAGAVLALVHAYHTSPQEHSLRLVFWAPGFYLYLQLGILLVKRIIVAWRTPLPTVQTLEYREAKEATRRYYLLMCDWNRVASTCGIVFWPILLSAPKAEFASLVKIWLGVWLVFTIAAAVWVEIRRKQLADMRVKAQPMRLPDLMGQAGMARWPVCFEPQVPMLVLKGGCGYSLNLANAATYWGTAYLIGMAGLLMLAPVMATAQTAAGNSIAGEWDGMIGKLHLVFVFEQPPEGGLKLKLTSPDQGNAVVPVDSVALDSGKLDLEMKAIGASYVATLSAAGDSFTGTWAQGAANLPLTLHRPGAQPAAFTLKPRTIGTVPLEPCRTVDGNIEGLCGTVSVWENRELKRGRHLALTVMVLPALQGGASDAFFPLAGGPGQSAIETYPATGYTNAIRKDRDVVLVDQRGTGGSAPLKCDLRDITNAQQVLGEEIPAERLRACREQLARTADLTQYTTSIFADDLDDVRTALGYEKIDVFGTSYGTRAALVYLRQHGSHVRTIGLEGVVSPAYRIPLSFSRALQSSIDQIIERCEATTACKQSYPDLRKEFDALLVRLDKVPAKADVTVGESKQTVTISKGLFVSALRPALYVPQVISAFPLMIHKAYEGDWSIYASVALQVRTAIDKVINRDLTISVACSEDIPGMTEALIGNETAGTYLGDYQVRQYQNYCKEWAHGRAPADFHAAVHSDVPALLISGALDPVTSLAVSRETARDLSKSQTVLLNNGTHGTGSPCVDGIVAKFVATAGTVDASCTDEMKLGPFLTETK